MVTMNKCTKCKSSLEGGSTVTEWGKVYQFCKLCSIVLEGSDRGGRVEAFLDDKLDISRISQSMIDARLRRAQGQSLWV
jgi:hypothetical protein